jgi:hypothetical protein
MNATPLKSTRSYRWLWLMGAGVPFGILMALRETSPSIWLRAGIAALAFVFFGAVYSRLKSGE